VSLLWKRSSRLARLKRNACGALFVASLSSGLANAGPQETREPAPQSSPATAIPSEFCTKPAAKAAASDKSAQKSARTFLLAAKKAYDENNYLESAKALQKAYETSPQVETLFNLAQTCREGSAARAALKLYEEVLASDPDDNIAAECKRHIPTLKVEAAAQLDKQAKEQLAQKDTSKAQALAEEAFKLDGKPLYVFHLAEAQRIGGQNREAILSYERYLNLATGEERQPEVLGHLSHLRAVDEERRAEEHTRAGEHTQAMAAWQAAYRSEPRPIYTFHIAESARQAGATGEAIASYQRFLRDTHPPDFATERKSAEDSLPQLQKELQDQKRPIYKRWWFWTIIGGAAAGIGAGIAAGVIAGQNQRLLPGVDDSNYRVLMPQLSIRY
jgi:tetratricopeptide (TPR) repeat protein